MRLKTRLQDVSARKHCPAVKEVLSQLACVADLSAVAHVRVRRAGKWASQRFWFFHGCDFGTDPGSLETLIDAEVDTTRPCVTRSALQWLAEFLRACACRRLHSLTRLLF